MPKTVKLNCSSAANVYRHSGYGRRGQAEPGQRLPWSDDGVAEVAEAEALQPFRVEIEQAGWKSAIGDRRRDSIIKAADCQMTGLHLDAKRI